MPAKLLPPVPLFNESEGDRWFKKAMQAKNQSDVNALQNAFTFYKAAYKTQPRQTIQEKFISTCSELMSIAYMNAQWTTCIEDYKELCQDPICKNEPKNERALKLLSDMKNMYERALLLVSSKQLSTFTLLSAAPSLSPHKSQNPATSSSKNEKKITDYLAITHFNR